MQPCECCALWIFSIEKKLMIFESVRGVVGAKAGKSPATMAAMLRR